MPVLLPFVLLVAVIFAVNFLFTWMLHSPGIDSFWKDVWETFTWHGLPAIATGMVVWCCFHMVLIILSFL